MLLNGHFFMHAPWEPHLNLLKRVLCYVKCSLDLGLQLHTSACSRLTTYTNVDWADCSDSHWSTSGYCIFFGDNLVSWSSKQKTTMSRSSAEAEYRAVAHTVAECCWLCQLFYELHLLLHSATVVYCNNISIVCMSSNPVQHCRTKHIKIDIHFVHEKVSLGQVRVLHVPSNHQCTDVMTKDTII